MQKNRQNLKWLGRMALIVGAAGIADALVAALARKPFPWVIIIPALIPVLTAVLVIIPMMKAEKMSAGS